MSIKTKLLLATISTFLFAGLISGFIQYYINSQKLTEHANQDIKETIDYTFQLVNFYLGRANDNLTNLANDSVIIEALETKDPAKLALASEKMTIVNEMVGVIENIGLHEVIGSTCIARSADKPALSVVGRDFSERDYCQGIINTKAPYLSSAFVSVVSKNPVLGLAIPVKNARGQILGYILGVIDLNELRGYLWDLQQDSSVVLLDRYGVMFLDTKQKLKALDNPPTALASEIQKRLTDNKSEGYFQDENNFIGHKSNGSLTVVFSKSAKILLTVQQYLNLTVFYSWVIALLLVIIAIYFFVGTITKRISRLSQITQQIAGGKFSIKLDDKDLKAKDEVGVLAKSFNEMAVKLADTYKGLEEKVKQRTKEVEEKNERLVKSEAELKKALDVAEQTNKLMVGRELKMKELKKKIEELGGDYLM